MLSNNTLGAVVNSYAIDSLMSIKFPWVHGQGVCCRLSEFRI